MVKGQRLTVLRLILGMYPLRLGEAPFTLYRLPFNPLTINTYLHD